MSRLSGLPTKDRIRARDMAVQAAALMLHNRGHDLHYTEGPRRWEGIVQHLKAWRGEYPSFSDCSSFVTWCLWNGLDHFHVGDIVNGEHWQAGYCVPTDAECLTRTGWKLWSELEPGVDETIGYNPETGENEWTPIESVHVFEDQEMVALSARGWNAVVTPHHRWSVNRRHLVRGPARVLTRNALGQIVGAKSAAPGRETRHERRDELVPTNELQRGDVLRLAAIAQGGSGLDVLPAEAAVIGWLLCEGHIRSRSYGRSRALQRAGTGGKPRTDALTPSAWGDRIGSATIYQSTPDGVDAIRRVLVDVPHREGIRTALRDGENFLARDFSIQPSWMRDLAERSEIAQRGVEGFVLALGREARRAFLDACIQGDGWHRHRTHTGKDGYVRSGSEVGFTQRRGPILGAVKLAMYLEGMRPSRDYPQRGGKYGDCHHIVDVRACRPTLRMEMVRSVPASSRDAWCPHTRLGSWTMRWREQITLTGNTGTLLDHGISVLHSSSFQRGDAVIYGTGAPGHHTALYVGGGMVISHGSENGPNFLRFDEMGQPILDVRRYV